MLLLQILLVHSMCQFLTDTANAVIGSMWFYQAFILACSSLDHPLRGQLAVIPSYCPAIAPTSSCSLQLVTTNLEHPLCPLLLPPTFLSHF